VVPPFDVYIITELELVTGGCAPDGHDILESHDIPLDDGEYSISAEYAFAVPYVFTDVVGELMSATDAGADGSNTAVNETASSVPGPPN